MALPREAHLVAAYENDIPRWKGGVLMVAALQGENMISDTLMKEGCWKKWYFSKMQVVMGASQAKEFLPSLQERLSLYLRRMAMLTVLTIDLKAQRWRGVGSGHKRQSWVKGV